MEFHSSYLDCVTECGANLVSILAPGLAWNVARNLAPDLPQTRSVTQLQTEILKRSKNNTLC